ncbi:MAG: FAD-binding oxidoreductase [Phycisphaerales bacterium]
MSLWRRSGAPERLSCDVCVLGGGIAGISAALELERRGASVVLLEATEIAGGASGRNAGFLMRGVADNYAQACRTYGRELARDVLRLTEANLEALREEGIEGVPGYSARPSCLVALGADEERELRESVTLMREDGFEAELIEAGAGPDDPLWRSGRPRCGLLNPNDGVCNPVELVRFLRQKLVKTRVVEGQAAHSIAMGNGGNEVVVHAADVRVSCGRVLACLNAYGPRLLGSLSGVITPRRGQLLAARPRHTEAGALAYAYYANRGSEYFRAAPDGLIVFGGARTYYADREVGYDLWPGEPVQSRIESFMRELVTSEYEVLARWAGTMGFSPDGLPLVGGVPGPEGLGGRVWFCGGFTGHGMSMAFLTARGGVEAMLGGAKTLFPIERVIATG